VQQRDSREIVQRGSANIPNCDFVALFTLIGAV
jgi:hypothetical protein